MNLPYTDELTGLLDRQGFFLAAEQALSGARRDGSSCLLIFAALEGVPEVEESLGDEAGGELIAHAGKMLREIFRDSDVIGRWGGDEFAVLAVGAQDAEAVKERIVQATEDLLPRSDCPYRLSFSTGIVRVDLNAPTGLDELLEEAQSDMCRDEREPKGISAPVRH